PWKASQRAGSPWPPRRIFSVAKVLTTTAPRLARRRVAARPRRAARADDAANPAASAKNLRADGRRGFQSAPAPTVSPRALRRACCADRTIPAVADQSQRLFRRQSVAAARRVHRLAG